MTLVKISRAEKDVIEKSMAAVNYPVKFYTIENNECMLLCEIPCDNPAMLWYLAAMCTHNICVDIEAQNRLL